MSETSVIREPRGRVLRGNEFSPVPLRVSSIKGDYNGNSLALTVGRAGDVQIEIADPVKGIVVMGFMPTSRNGINPEVTDRLVSLTRELASLIESEKLR